MTALPPLPRVQRALVQATERFAAELRLPTGQAPEWTDFEWSMACAAAVLHGVSPMLAGVLRWRGPRQWEGFLSEQRMNTALRQRRFEKLLARIDEEAVRSGIAIVPLKGAALYRLGLYSGGERPMADVDLLVAPCDAERAKQLLLALGYLDTFVSWKHRLFEPTERVTAAVRTAAASFGEHADRPLKIELHTRIAERLPLNSVDISGMIFPALPHPGLNRYPSVAALFTHLLLHAAGNIVTRSLRLIQLHDLALLAAHMRAADWTQLLASRLGDRMLWWAVPPLELLARYYPHVMPPDVLAPLRPDCPRQLRAVARRHTLAEVSLARLRIDAFPGIAWSNSLSERLSYVLGRVLPSRELLTARETIRTEAWATRGSWPRMSQGRRILRWALTRTPRPPVMHAVYCALEQPAIHAARRPPPADASRGAIQMP